MKCKRLSCFFMAAALVCTGLPGMAVPAREIQAREERLVEGDFEYELDGLFAVITKYIGNDTSVEIPPVFDLDGGFHPVRVIESGAFENCSSLTSVSIPEGVEVIYSAFSGCSGLLNVTIPESVTYIGGSAFDGCGSLTSVAIPEGVTYIGDFAFFGCDGLTSVTIPKGVKRIEGSVFSGCGSLTSVTIPEGVTYIGGSAFSGCGNLMSVSIPESVWSIEADAFGGTPWLEVQIEQGNGLAIVNHIVLDADEDILGAISIPKDVTRIGDFAFRWCGGLTSVTIPKGVTSIGREVFTGCSSLAEIYVEEGNEKYASEDGVLYGYGDETSIKRCLPGKTGFFTIPSDVTYIADYAFSECGGLTSVYIPVSVRSIGESAFDGCESLNDIYYGGSREQWDRIYIDSFNSQLERAKIHCNPSQPGGSENNGTGGSGGGETSRQKAQTITANNITKTYGVKSFSLGASALGGAALTYASSNKKVASVAPNGVVEVKGCGVAQITVTAAATKDYKAASKTVTLTVKPKKASLISVKSKKKKTALVKWKKDAKASGYMIECATDKKFKKNKVKMTVSKNKTVSATVKKLKAGKKYYVRACAFAKSGKKKIQGDWSKPKTVKVKK